ncbi:DegT/DnrJ/EryC1/StrS family aminotransferase, partial [Vibrio parahaemolyticus]
MSLTDLDRHNSQEIQFEEYVGVGFNYRMTDLQAAIGRVQLSKVSEIINQRRELVAIYQKYLSQVSELTL